MTEYLYLWLTVLGFLGGLVLLTVRKNRLDKQLAQEKSSLHKEYQTRNSDLNVRERILDQRTIEVARLEKVVVEKSKSFPWLAGAIADVVLLNNNKIADYLAFKPHPAKTSAQAVREVGKEKRILTAQLKHLQYVINQYEGLFPFLTEFREGEIEETLLEIKDTYGEQVSPEADPVSVYLTAGEYSNLSTTERNQRALERYMQGRKSPYQLGRDYELFIGYLYECEGYTVSYFGIENGKEDLGRDLICRKDGNTLIVQCKYWSKHKLIHEKHINQLFGTTVKFYLDSAEKKGAVQQLHLFPQLLTASNILGVFCTSTELSDTARKFAQALGIQVREQVKLGAFPMIKCHISPATGERIYHLPFDQMYDRTKLDKAGEFYALTVAEAEAKGFRRAWRWRG